ncbi:MAG: hypothetical protein AAF993_14015 [Pseudomonadota bacterium]
MKQNILPDPTALLSSVSPLPTVRMTVRIGRQRWLIALLACAITPATQATLCSMDGMQRSINVIYSTPGQPLPCEVVYEKASAAEDLSSAPTLRLWRAEHEAGFCESRAEEFVTKLRNLGWTCAVEETPITTMPESVQEPIVPAASEE